MCFIVPISGPSFTAASAAGFFITASPQIQCEECGHEHLLAFSCKRRHFCPSCHQKRVVEFGEWVCGEVLKKVPHRHFVFSIPKILRRYFLYDRSLLSELSHFAWEALRPFFQGGPQGVRSLGCLRPSSRNVCHLLSSGNLQSALMERSDDL